MHWIFMHNLKKSFENQTFFNHKRCFILDKRPVQVSGFFYLIFQSEMVGMYIWDSIKFNFLFPPKWVKVGFIGRNFSHRIPRRILTVRDIKNRENAFTIESLCFTLWLNCKGIFMDCYLIFFWKSDESSSYEIIEFRKFTPSFPIGPPFSLWCCMGN